MPPTLSVAQKLIRKGHRVRVLAEPLSRSDVEKTGAEFVSWTRAPFRRDTTPEADLLQDWEATNPIAAVARVRDRIMVGPSSAYAHDTLAALEAEPADVLVTSEMILGPQIAAEAKGVPVALLAANVWLLPQDGVPPFGPGLLPARNGMERLRDRLILGATKKAFAKGSAVFNAARAEFGLSPVAHPFDQVDRAKALLVLTSKAFDFASPRPDPRLHYCGAELGDPLWTEAWNSPWPESDDRPLVLVGLSTTFMNQGGVLSQIVDALGAMRVRGIVTVGPAVDPATLTPPEHVMVVRSAPHNAILPHAAAMVTHCGHGSVVRSLAHGVPLLCMPMGRDQDDNAARVAARGAGIRLKPMAQAAALQASLEALLRDPSYRDAARALGATIRHDAENSTVVEHLERLARGS